MCLHHEIGRNAFLYHAVFHNLTLLQSPALSPVPHAPPTSAVETVLMIHQVNRGMRAPLRVSLHTAGVIEETTQIYYGTCSWGPDHLEGGLHTHCSRVSIWLGQGLHSVIISLYNCGLAACSICMLQRTQEVYMSLAGNPQH